MVGSSLVVCNVPLLPYDDAQVGTDRGGAPVTQVEFFRAGRGEQTVFEKGERIPDFRSEAIHQETPFLRLGVDLVVVMTLSCRGRFAMFMPRQKARTHSLCACDGDRSAQLSCA
jgi:hypothetical protein